MKIYLVVGARTLSFPRLGGFVATTQFDETQPLAPQLQAYANRNRLSTSKGVVAFVAAAAIGGPDGRGPR